MYSAQVQRDLFGSGLGAVPVAAVVAIAPQLIATTTRLFSSIFGGGTPDPVVYARAQEMVNNKVHEYARAWNWGDAARAAEMRRDLLTIQNNRQLKREYHALAQAGLQAIEQWEAGAPGPMPGRVPITFPKGGNGCYGALTPDGRCLPPLPYSIYPADRPTDVGLSAPSAGAGALTAGVLSGPTPIFLAIAAIATLALATDRR